MAVVLQVDFKMDGPFGAELSTAFEGLARSIGQEPGFLWKIWTEDAAARKPAASTSSTPAKTPSATWTCIPSA